MEGIFPGAADIAAFWELILQAKQLEPASLRAMWEKDPALYLPDHGQDSKDVFLDSAFLVDEHPLFAYNDPNRQEKAGRYICELLQHQIPVAARAQTGLVLGAQWPPNSYLEQDSSDHLQQYGVTSVYRRSPVYSIDEQAAFIGAGLGGPHISVDVACASSLYAIAQAMAMLQSGQVTHAVVIGLNMSISLPVFSIFSHLGALDKRGHVRSYMQDAGGTFLGESVAGIVMEREQTAVARKANILGRICGLGLSSDGAERSVFTPGPKGQQLMFERAYQHIDGAPDYLEGHGTGTLAGDKAELEAMRHFFGPRLPAGKQIRLGSIKSLVGHTLAAAGMVAVIKALLIIQHRQLPPHLAGTLHPLLNEGCLSLREESTAIAGSQPAVRVGISAMGIGGGNAHLVLETAVSSPAGSHSLPDRFTFALQDMAWQYGNVGDHQMPAIPDRRQQFPDTLDIATKGLRSGPNFLKNISAFQLLALDKAHQLFDRHPVLANADNTAMLIHTNDGNHKFLQLNQRASLLYDQHQIMPIADRQKLATETLPPIDNDVIVSALPSMCAGYPAWHMNTRGGYMTSSGAMKTFYSSLLNGLLLSRYQKGQLLAGAGVYDDHRYADEYVCWFLFDTNDRLYSASTILLHYFPHQSPDIAVRKMNWPAHQVSISSDALPTDLLHFAYGDDQYLAIPLADGTLLLEQQHAMKPLSISKPQRPMSIHFNQRKPVSVNSLPARHSLLQEILLAEKMVTAQFKRLQQKVQSLLIRPASDNTATNADPVISSVSLKEQRATAILQVNEEHPYFFDHPLDHVPGILLLEGTSQLIDQQLQQYPPDTGAVGSHYINRLDMRFTRLCHCNRPAEIVIRPQAGRAYEGRIWQDEKVVATINMECSAAADTPLQSAIQPVYNTPPAHWLHKHREENILVSELIPLPGNSWSCYVKPPAATHFFNDGHPRWYSPCFVLEVCRQFFMLLSHQQYDIPVTQPMYLLDINFQLEQPLYREQVIELRHTLVTDRNAGNISHLQADIYVNDQRIGQFSTHSLILEKQSAIL
ncbi:hypothetical protein KTO58_01355 [Chitinophaga pendula]|nr:hypothetical protein KTO58_01355 [Chitinophaga pendula]